MDNSKNQLKTAETINTEVELSTVAENKAEKKAKKFGRSSKSAHCPSCGAIVNSNIRFEPSTNTHIIATLMCCFGGVCCVWMPYVIDSCQHANHFCPECNAFLGSSR